MSAFQEISEKFIKVIEEYIPELEGRIVIFGQQWQEFTDGKTYIILSLLDSEVGNFTEGMGENEWARYFHVVMHIYSREWANPLFIAERLAFCCDSALFINKFLQNGIGVFCNRKIRNLTGIEGAGPEQRYDVEFALKFIGRSEGTGRNFKSGGKIEGFATNH